MGEIWQLVYAMHKSLIFQSHYAPCINEGLRNMHSEIEKSKTYGLHKLVAKPFLLAIRLSKNCSAEMVFGNH